MSGPIRDAVAQFLLDDTFTVGNIAGALFQAPFDGFIEQIYVYAETGPVTVSGKINYTKDGGSPELTSGQRPTIPLGNQVSGQKTGLAKSISFGQMIQMTLEQAVEAIGDQLRLFVYMREKRGEFHGILVESADLTLVPSKHFTLLMSASGAARTITFPSMTGNDAVDLSDEGIRRGQPFIIQKTDSSGNAVTLDGDGSEQFAENGTNSNTITLTRQGETVLVQAEGVDTEWKVLLRKSPDSYYLARANHTGTQLASTISDFSEAVDDRVGALVIDTATIDATYDDGANTLALDVKANSITSSLLDEQTIKYVSTVLTNAQVLALRATPVVVVVAPGAGKLTEIVSGLLIFNRTAGYTETGDNLQLKYVDGSGSAASQEIETTGFIDAAGDAIINILPRSINAPITAAGELSNAVVVIHNTGDGEFGGGDAANTITVKLVYRVHSTGL